MEDQNGAAVSCSKKGSPGSPVGGSLIAQKERGLAPPNAAAPRQGPRVSAVEQSKSAAEQPKTVDDAGSSEAAVLPLDPGAAEVPPTLPLLHDSPTSAAVPSPTHASPVDSPARPPLGKPAAIRQQSTQEQAMLPIEVVTFIQDKTFQPGPRPSAFDESKGQVRPA